MKPVFSPETKKAVFLDLNQTLVLSNTSFKQSFRRVLADLLGRWDADADAGAGAGATGTSRETALDAIWQRYVRSCQQGNDKLPMRTRQTSGIRKALAGLPVPHTEDYAASVLRRIHEEQQQLSTAPNAERLLGELSKHYRLAILTNGNRQHQTAKLEKLKLSRWIAPEHIYASSALGARKPSPTAFLKAAEDMRVKPSEAVMIGDSWQNDAIGAISAGLDAIWIRGNKMKKTPPARRGLGRIYTAETLDIALSLFKR